MSKKKQFNLFYIFTIIVAAAFFFYSANFNTYVLSFHGITEEKELIISSEMAGTLKSIFVHPGEQVKIGQLLAELFIPELEIKLTELNGLTNQLKAQKIYEEKTRTELIKSLNAELRLKLSEIDAEISTVEQKIRNNKAISDAIFNDTSRNSGHIELNSLQNQKLQIMRFYQERIESIENESDSVQMPIRVEIEETKEQIKLLSSQRDKLKFCSPIEGKIGTVTYKNGETVAPFSTIVTVYPNYPSIVKGYIYEKDLEKISMGDKLEVLSLRDEKCKTTGIITGIGSRIIEFPTRLKKRPEFPVWGREILIKIDENNNFLLGETVLLKARKQELSFF